jgi:pheromone a factor receptor
MLTGITGSSLIIHRRLAGIAASRKLFPTPAEKRKTFYIDLFCGVGLPLIVMAISYVFQSHRFDITEGIGCEPVTWHCAGSLVLVTSVPVAICSISGIYGRK